MPWAQIDDLFADHPKVRALSDAAFRVHVAAICYCNRHLTDGLLVGHDQAGLTRLTTAELGAAVSELVTAGLWRRTDAGYIIHDFLDWNPTRARRLAERDAARNRKEKERVSRRDTGRDSRRKGSVTPPGVSDPSPSPTPSPKTETDLHTHTGVPAETVAAVLQALPDLGDGAEGLISEILDLYRGVDVVAVAKSLRLARKTDPETRGRGPADGLRRWCARASLAPPGRAGPASGRPVQKATSPAEPEEAFRGPKTF